MQSASFVPGDTITITWQIDDSVVLTSAATGSFDRSYSLLFRTVAPTLGSGDVNGDGSVDILDVSLTRRALAGLPITLD